jgi:hypothetical protein
MRILINQPGVFGKYIIPYVKDYLHTKFGAVARMERSVIRGLASRGNEDPGFRFAPSGLHALPDRQQAAIIPGEVTFAFNSGRWQ